MLPHLTAELDDGFYTSVCRVAFATLPTLAEQQTLRRLISALLDPRYDSDPELDLVGLGGMTLDGTALLLRVQFVAGPFDEAQLHRRVHFMFHVLAVIDQYLPLALEQFPPDVRRWRTEYMDYYDRDDDSATRYLRAALEDD